jgi:tRNA G46 methylase TrmB
MGQSAREQDADEFYPETYDDSVPDWPGEINTYRDMAASARATRGTVLEIAFGTGRVTCRLAQDGAVLFDLTCHQK